MTARLPKSPCTDGEVTEMVKELRSPGSTSIVRSSETVRLMAADLITSLSAERAEIAQALAFRGNVTSDRDRLSWCVAIAIDTLRDRAERAEAERDALKSPPDEVLERIIMAYEQGMIDRGYRARCIADKDAIPSMRAALAAAEGEQASIPAIGLGDNRT